MYLPILNARLLTQLWCGAIFRMHGPNSGQNVERDLLLLPFWMFRELWICKIWSKIRSEEYVARCSRECERRKLRKCSWPCQYLYYFNKNVIQSNWIDIAPLYQSAAQTLCDCCLTWSVCTRAMSNVHRLFRRRRRHSWITQLYTHTQLK